jgi:hypothetical protein
MKLQSRDRKGAVSVRKAQFIQADAAAQCGRPECPERRYVVPGGECGSYAP